MNIGADNWLAGSFDSSEEYEEALKKHQAQRAECGVSYYDLINADDFICGLVANIVRKFRTDSMSYPSNMQPEEWYKILESIERPLMGYVRMKATSWPDEEERMRKAAQDALRLFTDHLGSFWD